MSTSHFYIRVTDLSCIRSNGKKRSRSETSHLKHPFFSKHIVLVKTTPRRRCQSRGSPFRETKRRSVQIPANRTHQRRDYQRLEVLETRTVKRRGRSFRSLIWWCQQQHRKTDRLEVNLALYLCSFRVKLHLPLPPYTSACVSSSLCQSFASSSLSVVALGG